METPPLVPYEVRVDLVGEGSQGTAEALELLLGRRRASYHAAASSLRLRRVWSFVHRNDAEHAGELAEGLLEQTDISFRLWLAGPGASERRLLAQRAVES